MSRDVSQFLADIELACKKVLRFTAGVTYKQFTHDDKNTMLYFAISK